MNQLHSLYVQYPHVQYQTLMELERLQQIVNKYIAFLVLVEYRLDNASDFSSTFFSLLELSSQVKLATICPFHFTNKILMTNIEGNENKLTIILYLYVSNEGTCWVIQSMVL